MAKINKIINVKVEGVGKIKQLEESLKKLRKQQRDIKKDMKDGANATKEQTKQYKDSENAIKSQSKALRETKKAMLDANNTTKKSTSLQNSMAMGVIKGAAAFSILVTAFRRVNQALTTLIGTFTEFEFVMAKVKAVSGANEEEFKKLSDSAQELGRSTFFTASEVANLQLNLSKLGFTTDEVLAATEATINLSIATGSDLARSATVAGNAVRGFQLDATETGRVVDVMAVAFTSSALDIEKWQTSMTKVAPIATMAGFSIEETTAIMAKLSDTGIEASIAGTSLRNIFLKMQDPTSELTRKVGHTIHSLDDMLKVFKDMQAEGTDLADVLTFMDVRQVAAFGTMLQGADDIQVLVEELENADGAGKRMSDTVGDTLQGGIFRVKSALEGLSIAMVEKFGGALKKTLVKFADWLNKLVGTEGALEKIGTKIKFVTKLILAYVIGVKGAVLWTNIIGSSFVTNGKKAGYFVTALGYVKGALVALRGAIASTGIGLLIIGLADLYTALTSTSAAAGGLTDDVGNMKESMKPYLKEIKLVEQAEEQLIKSRKEMAKLLDKEGNLLNDTQRNQMKLSRAREKEATHIKTLNKFLKQHGKEQIKIKDNNDDIADSITGLVSAMREQMLFEVYTKQQGTILERAVSVEMLLEDFQNQYTGGTKRDGKVVPFDEEALLSTIKKLKEYRGSAGDVGGGLIDWFTSMFGDANWARETLDMYDDWIEDRGLTYDEIITIMESDDYIGDQEKSLENAITRMGKKMKTDFSFSDIFPEAGSDDDDDSPESQNAINTQQVIMSRYLNKFYSEGITNEEDYRLGLLEAQKKGLNAYIEQETNVAEKNRANVQLMKLQKQIDDEVYKQLLTSIERERVTKKEAAQLDVLDGTAQSTDLYDVLNEIDEEQNKKVLKATEDAGKDESAIQSKINQQSIINKRNNFKEAERVASEAYEKEKLDLELSYANEEISKMERDARILALEAQFLADMADLYAKYGQAHVDIDNDITENTIATKEQQKEALRDYISALGDLGGLMQDVAGEEDEMNAVRKAGIIITESAAAAEKILSLMTTLSTLATKADIALTPAKVATDGAKTGSTLALTGAKFLEAIADGIKGLPWWAQLIGVVAILGIIKKAKSNISSAFKTPDSGGGGGTDNEGGMMSLMTFGGRHQTVGEIDGYAKGGMVHGNSHAQGGEKFAVGGRVVELEGGEAVINKRSTSMFRSQLSAMNYAGGGVSFADGGVTNIPSFAKTQFDVAGQQGLQGAMSQRSKVVVVEADITQSQNTVSAIESEAAF